MLNKSINVAKKPEISSHLMAYDSSLTFIARNFKKLGIDKKKFTSDFIVLLNGDNYKNHNIYETLLIFTNKYLIKINNINYENFRLELSK